MKKIYILASLLFLVQNIFSMEQSNTAVSQNKRQKNQEETKEHGSNNISTLTYFSSKALVKNLLNSNKLNLVKFLETLPVEVVEYIVKQVISKPLELDKLKKTLLHKVEDKHQVITLLDIISYYFNKLEATPENQAEFKELLAQTINAKDGYDSTPLLSMLTDGKSDAAVGLLDYAKSQDISLDRQKNRLGINILDAAIVLDDKQISDKLDINALIKQPITPAEKKWEFESLESMLSVAAERNPEILKNFLSDNSITISQVTLNKLLLIACRYQSNPEVIKLLIDRGANVNAANAQGCTALMFACLNQNNSEVIKLLIDRGANVNAVGVPGWTALIIACQYQSNPEIIKLLIDSQANVNTVSTHGLTALMRACQYQNNLEIIKLLIDREANINAANAHGWTALMIACRYQNNPEIIKLLIDNQANVNTVNAHGLTALMRACQYQNNLEIIKLLIDREANVNAVNVQGYTALMLACRYQNNPEIIKLLIDKGANVNAVDAQGGTALIVACYNSKSLEMIKLLLESGADVNVSSFDQKTALFLAYERRLSPAIIQLLIDKGAKFNDNKSN